MMLFHHFGVACKNLDREMGIYSMLGYASEGPDFEDPIQGVRGRFLVGGGPRVEILEALPGSDVLDPWLQNGSRIYHQAFEVSDILTTIELLENKRARVIVQPVPSVAFDGRLICFLMLKNMMLIELIESSDASQ